MMNNGIKINKKTMNTDNFTALNKKMNNEKLGFGKPGKDEKLKEIPKAW